MHHHNIYSNHHHLVLPIYYLYRVHLIGMVTVWVDILQDRYKALNSVHCLLLNLAQPPNHLCDVFCEGFDSKVATIDTKVSSFTSKMLTIHYRQSISHMHYRNVQQILSSIPTLYCSILIVLLLLHVLAIEYDISTSIGDADSHFWHEIIIQLQFKVVTWQNRLQSY